MLPGKKNTPQPVITNQFKLPVGLTRLNGKRVGMLRKLLKILYRALNAVTDQQKVVNQIRKENSAFRKHILETIDAVHTLLGEEPVK